MKTDGEAAIGVIIHFLNEPEYKLETAIVVFSYIRSSTRPLVHSSARPTNEETDLSRNRKRYDPP